MKAILLTRYGTPDELQLGEVNEPEPEEDEVLVEVYAAAVNDWDWMLVRGTPFYIRLIGGLHKPRILVPGVEVAGRVRQIGKGVTKFRLGDAVYGDLSECGFGGFAEFVCAPQDALTRKAERMSFCEAAAIPHAAALALQGLRDEGGIQPGHHVLINGAGGGVGTLGVQIARAFGAVVAGVDSAGKLEVMRQLGFDHVIDYHQEDFTRSDRTYDLILDTKTNRSPFDYLRVLRPGGKYVTVGGATGRLVQALALGPFVRRVKRKDLRLVGLKPNQDMQYINALYASGVLKPVIDGPYALSEVPEAIRYFGEGRHKGKVVIRLKED